MNETAISAISVLPVGKKEMERFINLLVDEICSGANEPLQVLVRLKYAEKVIAETLKCERVDEVMIREYEKYGKGEKVVIHGAELKQMETGVKYDYNGSGDPVWMDLDKKISELTEKKKQREKMLQNIDQGIVDPETGVFINKPPKTSKTKILVTIK